MAWHPPPFWPLGVLLYMCHWGGLLDPRSYWSGHLTFLLQQRSAPAINFFLKCQRETRPSLLGLTNPSYSQPRGPFTFCLRWEFPFLRLGTCDPERLLHYIFFIWYLIIPARIIRALFHLIVHLWYVLQNCEIFSMLLAIERRFFNSARPLYSLDPGENWLRRNSWNSNRSSFCICL